MQHRHGIEVTKTPTSDKESRADKSGVSKVSKREKHRMFLIGGTQIVSIGCLLLWIFSSNAIPFVPLVLVAWWVCIPLCYYWIFKTEKDETMGLYEGYLKLAPASIWLFIFITFAYLWARSPDVIEKMTSSAQMPIYGIVYVLGSLMSYGVLFGL